MSEWKAFVGKISLFPAGFSGPVVLSALDLFQRVWGPEVDSFQGATNPLNPSVAQGRRDGLAVSCTAHPSRIDFSCAADQGQIVNAAEKIPTIDNVVNLRKCIETIMKAIDSGLTTGAISRIAVFVQFLRISKDREEANRNVVDILPDRFRLRLESEEDFMLQVNEPASVATVVGARMNIITKWSVERFQLITFQLPSAGIFAGGQFSSNPEETLAASVSFDNNSVPSNTPISSHHQFLLLEGGFRDAIKKQSNFGLNVDGLKL